MYVLINLFVFNRKRDLIFFILIILSWEKNLIVMYEVNYYKFIIIIEVIYK